MTIYIYVCGGGGGGCVCIGLGSSRSFKHVSLNNKDKKLSKLFKKYKHTLHKQAAPDEGQRRGWKHSGQFWEIHLPIPTWN